MKRLLLCTLFLSAVPLTAHAAPPTPEPELALVAPGPIATVAAMPTLHALELTQAAPANSPTIGVATAPTGLLGTLFKLLAGGAVMTIVLEVLRAIGAPQKAGDAIQALPPVNIHSKSQTFNEATNAAGNFLETNLKGALTGDKLQAFLDFLKGSPSEASVLAYLEQNFGQAFLQSCATGLPALLQAELGILGGHLPSVVGGILAKLAPKVAVAQGQQQLTAAQVSNQIAALAGVKAAA